MPYIVHGEHSKNVDWSLYKNKDFNYKYPEGLDLKPGSELHNKIRDKIYERAIVSRNEISKRFDSWNEIDKVLTTYITLDNDEEDIKDKDPRKPVSIIFPYSYSMIEALLTYLSLAFFQDPIFQYEAVDDEDTMGAMLLEMVIRLHCIKTKVPLAIHTALRDGLGYGVGIAVPVWKTVYGKRLIKSAINVENIFGNSVHYKRVPVQDVIFEGNGLNNIDPYSWLPDPSVSSNNIQDGEFIGWIDRDNYMNLLEEESNGDGSIFNVKYLKFKKDKRSTLAKDQSRREEKFGGSSRDSIAGLGVTSPVDIIKMYVNLIPKEWELGDSEYPEKWYFELAADDVIISCEKADFYHGMYPIAVNSPEFDGYSITPISRMEILYGLQHTLDFLFNSHIENVRKAVNDMFVVDPYLINILDVKDPKRAGRLIRLRRPAWGRGVSNAIEQLQVNDITRLNISDSAYITQWMDRISGADQSMQGALRLSGPERLTSAEFQSTRSSAISRLKRLAMVISVQFMQDIGTMFAAHTQQFMSKDTFVRLAGPRAEQLTKFFGSKTAKVSINDLAIDYDVIVRDGSIPGNDFTSAWIEMFKVITQSPELMQTFDVFKIFSFIAQEMGARNIEDFRKNVQNIQTTTMPDEQVLREQEKGNIIPVGVQ